MNGCIEREKALNLIDRYWQQAYLAKFTDIALWLGSVYREIDNIPTADVRPVLQGRWQSWTQDRPPCKWYSCDYCGFHALSKSNYCPNCGADMRE